MAKPIASFSIIVTGLSIQVFDTSGNTPTSWTWEWGDASANGTTQDANHTYAAEGVYMVRLTATNGDGSSITTKEIYVSTTPALGMSLKGFVELNIPTYINVPDELVTTLIKKWQLLLQNSSSTPIPDADVYNELAWPQLYNILIAYATVYDIFLKVAADTMGYSMSSSNVGAGGDATGPIKQITVGPSETQFYDPTAALARIFVAVPGSSAAFDQVLQEVCHTASILGIKMPMCKRAYNPVISFVKSKFDRGDESNNLNDLIDKYF